MIFHYQLITNGISRMRTWVLAFLIGVVFLQTFYFFPPLYWGGIILVFILFLTLRFRKEWHYIRLIVSFFLGFTWCLCYAHFHNAWTLPEDWQGKPLTIGGYIASIPNASLTGESFLFSLKKIQFASITQTPHAIIKLTWRNNTLPLHVGDKWNFHVHLKKTYGTMNPGGFDYEAFAFQEGIRANGYILEKENNKLIYSHWYHYPIDRMRQSLAEKIAANLPVTQTSQWITALVIGERHGIDEKDWQVLRNTGTNHLMAIAGLHIGLMSALAHFLVASIWRRFPHLVNQFPAVHAGAVAALLMALIYSALAGFSIPTQRACLMLTFFLVALLMRRKIGAWYAWSGALLCVLLLNPLTVLTESFWLSFGSVALIIYGVSGRLSPKGLWWQWGRIQWVIALGLVPLSIALFQQCSFISFAANSVAIPWVGFIIVPLSLLGSFLFIFSNHAATLVLTLADKILSVLWIVLTWFSHLPNVVWYQTIPHTWMLIAAIIGMLFLLFPAGFPGRYLGIIWLLPLALYKPSVPQKGEAWLTLLDIGQGLSAVVQTQTHTLVFDTGARLSASFDMGDSVVVPFLHSINTKKIDMLVISHSDNDHIGGADAVMTQLPVQSVKTSVPKFFTHADLCLRGDAWTWDNVNFTFLYPTRETLNKDNNSSCVLRVSSGNQQILLTGDIEKFAEKDLAANEHDNLHATILIAPHHGSKTSALKNFVNLVDPKYVLFATGYRNRYHFPHPSVVKLYQEKNVSAYNTANTGAIQFQLNGKRINLSPKSYRELHKHYWNN
jgi:competence protein ComEC